MDESILRTRLHIPPLPPGQVERQRLYERLDDGSAKGRRLTLVSAPPGSGKTTLLSGWAAQSRERVAWLTLDAEQNDLPRFRAYLLAAMRTAAPELARKSSRAKKLASVLGVLDSLEGRVMLILDDYHAISEQAVHDELAMLFENMPPGMHLTLATRVDPPFAIARLRARGQLSEIRTDDLRFSANGAGIFLNERMGLRLSEPDVETLKSKTEGWIAGLQLAALSLREREDPKGFISSFSGGHPHLRDYLSGEVIDRQTESDKAFLIQTSILGRLSGSLCSAVSGRAESAALLSELECANLFTSALDGERVWYRYHALFAEALRYRLERDYSAERIRELRLKASDWLEGNGFILEALSQARAARDFERVARLAEKAARGNLADSRMAALLDWVTELPAVVLRAHPRLRVIQALGLFINGSLAPAQKILIEVRQTMESLVPSRENESARAETSVYLETMETLVSGFAQAFNGDLEKGMRFYRAAREKALSAGILPLAAIATEGMALARYTGGFLHQSARHCKEVIELGMKGAREVLPLAAAGHIELAGIHTEWNDRREAERHLGLGMALVRGGIDATILADACLAQSRLYKIAGDGESALEALRQADLSLAAVPYSVTHFNLEMRRVELSLSAGRLDEARKKLRELEAIAVNSNFNPAIMSEARNMSWVRSHLASGEPRRALELLDELAAPAEAAGRYGRLMKMHVFRALALEMKHDTEAALASLGRSFEMAEPQGFVRLYLDEGAPLAALLRLSAKRGMASAYAARLLSEWDSESSGAENSRDAENSRLGSKSIEALTPTELKVLRLIAEGRSNREIAERLVIALNTVKRHTNHIYGKLDVRSRTQAIVRARSSGMIPI